MIRDSSAPLRCASRSPSVASSRGRCTRRWLLVAYARSAFRSAKPHRVAEIQPVRIAHRGQEDLLAAEGHADADLHPGARAARIAQRADAADLADHLVRRAALVGEAVAVAAGQGDQHQVRLAVQGPFGAPEVRHQHGGPQPRQDPGEAQHLGGVGQLRHPVGRHEGAELHLALPGQVGIVQPFELEMGGQHAGDALQPVAKADLPDDDPRGQRRS